MNKKPYRSPPFKDDVLAASWESGWADGCEEQSASLDNAKASL